jgi:hypothetical protein
MNCLLLVWGDTNSFRNIQISVALVSNLWECHAHSTIVLLAVVIDSWKQFLFRFISKLKVDMNI